MPYSVEAKQRAQRFVARVRAITVCARCGRQPVEWHNEEHERHPNRRVAKLAALGFPLERIKAEMRASEALCRSCHMAADGRAAALTAARPFKAGDTESPKPCVSCGEPAKPLRRGMCRRCYDAQRRA